MFYHIYKALLCLWQDYKDLELDIIPASLTHTDPEVNLNDPNQEVNEEKKKSARKKEWEGKKNESIKCSLLVFFISSESIPRQSSLLLHIAWQLVPEENFFSDQYLKVQTVFYGTG